MCAGLLHMVVHLLPGLNPQIIAACYVIEVLCFCFVVVCLLGVVVLIGFNYYNMEFVVYSILNPTISISAVFHFVLLVEEHKYFQILSLWGWQ